MKVGKYMPTLSQMNLPTPKSWDEFEEITLDALKIRWSVSNLFRYGRQGQPQNGVDIYGNNNLNEFVGIQCKKYDLHLNISTIKEEIAKAEKFNPCLQVFYFATTLKRDVKLQEEIGEICRCRVENKKFPVYILFWEDIFQDLVLNEAVLRKHYPQLFVFNDKLNNPNILGLLPLVYYGKNLRFYMNMIFVELMTNPLDMEYVCDCINNGRFAIKDEAIRDLVSRNIIELKNYLFNSSLIGKVDNIWDRAINTATRIENTIDSLKGFLEEKELLIYKLCEILGIWDRKVYKDIIIDKVSIDEFLKLLDNLYLQQNIVHSISNILLIDLNDSEKINANFPAYIYRLIQDSLIIKNVL